jgi:hypothetical protein
LKIVFSKQLKILFDAFLCGIKMKNGQRKQYDGLKPRTKPVSADS